MQFLKQVIKKRILEDYSLLRQDFSWIKNYKLIYELYIIIPNKISGMHFFVWKYILDWIKDNALQSLGECLALLWLVETVNFFLPLLLSEWTVFSIAGNMCSKDLDKQYTLDIVFLFCTALFFILMSLLQMHYIFLPCMVYKTKILLTVFHCHTILIENVCRLSCKSMLPTMFIKMCVKLKHIHLASSVEVEKLTSKVNAALW